MLVTIFPSQPSIFGGTHGYPHDYGNLHFSINHYQPSLTIIKPIKRLFEVSQSLETSMFPLLTTAFPWWTIIKPIEIPIWKPPHALTSSWPKRKRSQSLESLPHQLSEMWRRWRMSRRKERTAAVQSVPILRWCHDGTMFFLYIFLMMVNVVINIFICVYLEVSMAIRVAQEKIYVYIFQGRSQSKMDDD